MNNKLLFTPLLPIACATLLLLSWNSLVYPQNENNDSSTFFTTLCKALVKIDVALEITYDWDEGFSVKPPQLTHDINSNDPLSEKAIRLLLCGAAARVGTRLTEGENQDLKDLRIKKEVTDIIKNKINSDHELLDANINEAATIAKITKQAYEDEVSQLKKDLLKARKEI